MPSSPTPAWWQTTFSEVWRNGWTRALMIIFVAFEIYNNAILPAIKGTYDTERSKSEAVKADADAKNAASALRYLQSPANGITSLTFEQRKKIICADNEMKAEYGRKYGCPE